MKRTCIHFLVLLFAFAPGFPANANPSNDLEGTHLKHLGVWPERNELVGDFRYRDGFIYAINGFKFQIIDVKDWEKPILLSELEFPAATSNVQFFENPRAFAGLEIIGQRAYIVQTVHRFEPKPAMVIDISNPVAPRVEGETPMDVLIIKANDRFVTIAESLDLIILESDPAGRLVERSRVAYLDHLRIGIPPADISLTESRAYLDFDGTPHLVDLERLDQPRVPSSGVFTPGTIPIHQQVVAQCDTLFGVGDFQQSDSLHSSIWNVDADANLMELASIPFDGASRLSHPHFGYGHLYFFERLRDREREDEMILHAFDVSDRRNPRALGSLTLPYGAGKAIASTETHLLVTIGGQIHFYEILKESVVDYGAAFREWAKVALCGVFFVDRLQTADPDRDGTPNFLEMAAGRDPLRPDDPGRRLQTADDGFRFVYQMDAGTSRFFDYEVEVSADLQEWISISEATSLGVHKGVEQMAVSLPTDKPYARLRVAVKSGGN